MLKSLPLTLPIFFVFSCPALANYDMGRWSQVYPRVGGAAFHYHPSSPSNATLALRYSTESLYGYLRYNYSSNVYRVVMGTERLLTQINEFAQQPYNLREEVFYVNRAFKILSDGWRRYEGFFDMQAKSLFKNVENDLNTLNRVTGGRGPLPIPSIPRSDTSSPSASDLSVF